MPQDQYSEDSKEEGNFFTTASEKIHQEFDLNIYGTILPTQIFGEVLIGQENANIINVSSMGAYHPMTRIPGYAGAKAAVTNFTEWAAYGVGGNLFREKRCQGERSRAGVLPDAAKS